MNKEIKLTASLEDYLETILQLENKNRVARVKDIASHLKVRMPSVTGALKNLKSKGLIEYEKNSYINLTKRGLVIATKVFEKHQLLVSFFKNVLLLDDERATNIGCGIEHIIDIECVKKLKNVQDFLETNTKDKDSWEKIIDKI